MHLISHEVQGCIMVWVRVFVPQHLSRMVAVPNPLKDFDVDGKNIVFRPVQKLSQNTEGVICLNPSGKRLPDTAAATAWRIMINLKTN